MTPETERDAIARAAIARAWRRSCLLGRNGGAPYTVTLTIQRTLVVPIELASDVETAIASAVLLVHATDEPERRYQTSPDADTGKGFRVVYADAYNERTPRDE
jgi:hypothetical protein